jgi:hypothetical protein
MPDVLSFPVLRGFMDLRFPEPKNDASNWGSEGLDPQTSFRLKGKPGLVCVGALVLA